MSMNFFKDKKSRLTRAILILLAVTFVVGFGYVGSISLREGSTASAVAVTVNGEPVSLAKYYLVRDNFARRLVQGMDSIPDPVRDYISYAAMKQIVEGKLLAQKARELGFVVTDEELRDFIKSNPAFQHDGKFIGSDNYKNLIRKELKMSVSEFEEGLREELLIQKLIDMINSTAKVTDEELINLYKTQNEKMKLDYIVFTPEQFADAVTVKEDDIANYYEQNKSDFVTDEKRVIRYIKVTKDVFAKDVDVSDQEIEAYFNAYKEEFRKNDETIPSLSEVKEKIRNTLIEKRVASLYNQFKNSLSEKIKDKTLEEIIKENSLGEAKVSEPLTTSDQKMDIPASVINKAFALKEGDVAFLKDKDGIWIFGLKDVIPSKQKSLEEVKKEIIKQIKVKKGEDAARVAAEEALKRIKQEGKSLVDVAKGLGVEVKHTDYFTRLKPPPFIRQDLVIDLFLLTKKNPVLPRVHKHESNYYILAFGGKKPADLDKFYEKKEEIKQQELIRLRRGILSKWIEDLYSDAEIVYNTKLLPIASSAQGS